MLKRFFLKLVVNDTIKKMPLYKSELAELIRNNLDEVLDKVENVIKEALLNLIAKKANK